LENGNYSQSELCAHSSLASTNRNNLEASFMRNNQTSSIHFSPNLSEDENDYAVALINEARGRELHI